MNGVRMDKWLWAARFFKTRTLAADACELGRIHLNGQPVKPAREVQAGMMLKVKTPGGEFEIRVEGVSDERGPAAVAQQLYQETDASKESRARLSAERRMVWNPEAERTERPNKRDRRQLSRLRGES
jgi:ribosome-associated heat shock protein Hsp15